MSIAKRLQEIEEHYEEITRQLGDPDVVTNHLKYQKLAKEHSDLTEIVEVWREQVEVRRQLSENRQLVDDPEPEIRELALEEVADLEERDLGLSDRLKKLLLPKDPLDKRNIFLEIRAGAGGNEAGLFAGSLFRMYSRFAEARGWKVEITSANHTDLGGFKEVIANISGKEVYSQLKYESGVHRVQRVPETESSGRIHTSTVTVAVLPEAEEVDMMIDEKKELRIDVFRSSGPGGQSVNTTDSAIRITHIPTGLVVTCQDEKSQHKNKAKALKVLRSRLLEAETQRQRSEIAATRREQVGTGERSERIRTYNYPENRVTDHRISLTVHKLDRIMEGELVEIVEPLRKHAQAEALKSGSLE